MRYKNIINNLSYARSELNRLHDEIEETYKNDSDIKYLSQHIGNILSSTRETFDYLMHDIFEYHILPNSKNIKLINKYKRNELNLYFPFHKNQLNNDILKELKITDKKVYKFIEIFISKIERKKSLGRLTEDISILLEMKDIVNDKKHINIINTIEQKHARTFVEYPDGSTAIIGFILGKTVNADSRELGPVNNSNLPPGSKSKTVHAIRIQKNDREVGYFCMICLGYASEVFNSFYSKFHKLNKKYFKTN